MKSSRFSVLLVILSAFFLAACGSAAATPAADETGPAPSSSILAEGALLPVRSLDLAFAANGRVAEVLAAEGASVKAGQVIARLEVASLEARQADLARAELEIQAAKSEQAAAALEALNAQQSLDELAAGGAVAAAQLRFTLADLAQQLDALQADLEDEQERGNPDELIVARLQAQIDLLKAQQDKTQNDLDQYNNQNLPADRQAAAQARLDAAGKRQAAAQARMTSAEAGLKSAQAALKGVELVAPWNGVLAANSLKPGAWVLAGQSVAALADTSSWVVETDNLTEFGVVGVKPGDSVKVTFDALPDLATTGTVESVDSRFIEKRGDVTYTVRIRLELSNPELRWGMTAAVRFDK